MIYVKKKTFLKKVKNSFKNIFANKINENLNLTFNFFSVFKFLLGFIVLLTLSLYLIYLFLLPCLINEQNLERVLNNYLSQNSKLVLDIENIKISPNYKFEVCINVSKVKLKYNSKKDFITVDNSKTRINFLTLFLGYIDLNNVKIENLTINTNFTKNQKYSALQAFPLDFFDLKKHNSKFKIRNLSLLIDNLDVNIYDENIKKQFKIKTKNTKFEKKYSILKLNNDIFPYLIRSKGKITAKNKILANFDLNLSYRTKENEFKKVKSILENLNYNPFVYADKYNFYADFLIDLKMTSSKLKNNLSGNAKISDLSFVVNDIQIPKNNLSLNFKNDKIYSNFNFKLIKNQFFDVKSIIDISKNKSIELEIKSSEINLSDFHQIIENLVKILNLKINFNDFELSGILNADLYIKSNFKTIISSGLLKIQNAKLKHKKLNLSLNSINSNINLKNDKINFNNSVFYFDKSKFNIKGEVDKNACLNLEINSDLIDFAQFVKFISTLPLISRYGVDFNGFEIKSGLLKINSIIKGTIDKPLIQSDSNLKNLVLLVKSNHLSKKKFLQKHEVLKISVEEIKITPEIIQKKFESAKLKLKNVNFSNQKYKLKAQNLDLKLMQNEIQILKTKVDFNGLIAEFEANIKDFEQKNPIVALKINSSINKKNNLIQIENIKTPTLKADLIIKKNNLRFLNCAIFDNEHKIAMLEGGIDDIFNNLNLNKLKITIPQRLSLFIPIINKLSFDVLGNIEFNGKIQNPKINGHLNLFSISYPQFGLFVNDVILNFKDSNCYLNIVNGKIFDFKFDAVSQVKCFNEKLFVEYLDFNSPYVKLSAIEKYLNNQKTIKQDFIQISNLKGNVETLELDDFSLSKLLFEGEYKNGILKINKFSSNVFQGSASGDLTFDFASLKTNLNLVLKELNIRHLKGIFKDLTIAASGKLSALIKAEFFGIDVDNFSKTLDAYVKFNINDGELAQFAKFERFLQAGNVLSQSILKLTLNSTLSAVSKQNTGYFKTIEGTIKIKSNRAVVQYLKSRGANMSLYMEGNFDLVTKLAKFTILGKIPVNITNILGAAGNFSTETIVDKMDDDSKTLVKTITASPVERMLTMKVLASDAAKIPPLAFENENISTREFLVKINGKLDSIKSIQTFKWVQIGE